MSQLSSLFKRCCLSEEPEQRRVSRRSQVYNPTVRSFKKGQAKYFFPDNIDPMFYIEPPKPTGPLSQRMKELAKPKKRYRLPKDKATYIIPNSYTGVCGEFEKKYKKKEVKNNKQIENDTQSNSDKSSQKSKNRSSTTDIVWPAEQNTSNYNPQIEYFQAFPKPAPLSEWVKKLAKPKTRFVPPKDKTTWIIPSGLKENKKKKLGVEFMVNEIEED